jgi:hypothetical protein
MKRTCNGCRALSDNFCLLGYKTVVKKYFDYLPVEYKPLEECPKPKTNDEYVVADKKSS